MNIVLEQSIRELKDLWLCRVGIDWPQPTDFRSHEWTSSVYGISVETHLTSTHPFHLTLPGITLDNVQEKLRDGEATTLNSMGSNFYMRALRGAPSRSQPETPMPPNRMTGFNPGPWNPHSGLSTWCVPGKRLQLTKPYSLRKTCGSTGKEMNGDVIWFTMTLKSNRLA